ncbi:hypothetical protein BIY29_05350 [Brenneria alni]|uniref:Uncharacterized protein n=1 Tax=Brenneria alni TaxID=71656 RepID=A0A421DQY7_9GAMM|nr:hypothetical protein [Brenneria alni]RLM26487.1 hypothetical protein BIY29_05350 [Brenneria alni]
MRDEDSGNIDGIDGTSINTLEDAAIIINSFVCQGRIGPARPDDFEAESILAHLSILVHQVEAGARKREG